LTFKYTKGDFIRKFLFSLNAFALSVIIPLIIAFLIYGISETDEHGGKILNPGILIIIYSFVYITILLIFKNKKGEE